ncbi:hypothetical protein [Myxococcus faecalis]|uniref:hypothetical protein n=1 Tax=Myxococcus faecalis TaxID=3115646 RepID=UPI003CF1FB39
MNEEINENEGDAGDETAAESRTSVPKASRRARKSSTKKHVRRKKGARPVGTAKTPKQASSAPAAAGTGSNYPRHALPKTFRIPKAILDQNAGKPCSDRDALNFAGLGFNGPNRVEISSAIKYGLLSREPQGLTVTELGKKILRPQTAEAELEGKREAVQNAPVIGQVYSHYRGENLPDAQFFANALADTFGVPTDKISEFSSIFRESLASAGLLEEKDGKIRILDTTHSALTANDNSATLAKLGKKAAVAPDDTCFVIMPFAPPIGTYYSQIYEKAIQKAGLKPVRADTEIFGTGKIIDQIWRGIHNAKVLVAELTTKNANVFYELGLAHALNKPVVLVSANEPDVPFDLRHIRVIYYDTTDPFWGQKLMDKIAENILSALTNPEEALFKRALEST